MPEPLIPVYPPVLEAVMRRRGLTRPGLARESGISVSLLRALLDGGVRTTTRENVESLAQALRIDVELISGVDVPGLVRR